METENDYKGEEGINVENLRNKVVYVACGGHI
jgi:hypothetical protein